MALHLNYIWSFTTIAVWIRMVCPMALLNPPAIFLDGEASESDLAEYISSKGYLPRVKNLLKSSTAKTVDNDATYLLSKLSDQDLIKLLNEQPKKSEYDLQDIIKVAINSDNVMVKDFVQPKTLMASSNNYDTPNNLDKRIKLVPQTENSNGAFFKLDHKKVEPYNHDSSANTNYLAVQKLSNLLHSRNENENKNIDEDDKNELLFDLLVAQLKTLCCKKSNLKKNDVSKYRFKSLLNDLITRDAKSQSLKVKDAKSYTSAQNPSKQLVNKMKSEHMFLILNDEVNSNGSEDIISVDPESLSKNSSVLLLGPISTPLNDVQLKLVMTRISNELSKPEYLPLLQQLSDGVLSDNNIRIMKSLVSGPETRRYIKPHRCNHQSPLAKVYGGPKWLICTGYLNINTPSLYD